MHCALNDDAASLDKAVWQENDIVLSGLWISNVIYVSIGDRTISFNKQKKQCLKKLTCSKPAQRWLRKLLANSSLLS